MIFGKSKRIKELEEKLSYLQSVLKEKIAKEMAENNLEVAVKKLIIKTDGRKTNTKRKRQTKRRKKKQQHNLRKSWMIFTLCG